MIIRYLDQEYFRPRFAPRYPPVEELVFTILSQNTTDINAGRALESLRKKYPDWEDVARAPVREHRQRHQDRAASPDPNRATSRRRCRRCWPSTATWSWTSWRI